MSFYRSALAAIAAIVLVTPVFADEDASVAPQALAENNAAPVQLAENNVAENNLAENNAAQVAPVAENDAAPMQVADNSMQAGDQATMAGEAKVNINKATVKELMKVKGMNAAHARALVAYRKKHGDFKNLADMKNVKGFKKMKEEKLMEMETQLTVE